MYTFEVQESESKDRISKFQHFIRQTRLFSTKGYFFGGIDFRVDGILKFDNKS